MVGPRTGHASRVYIPVLVGLGPPIYSSPTIQILHDLSAQMRGEFVLELHNPGVTTVRSHNFQPGFTADKLSCQLSGPLTP